MPTIEDNRYNRKYLTFALSSGYVTQQMIANTAVMPMKTSDPIHSLHRVFIHLGYLYIDLREAIRWENGPQIIRHWKYWTSNSAHIDTSSVWCSVRFPPLTLRASFRTLHIWKYAQNVTCKGMFVYLISNNTWTMSPIIASLQHWKSEVAAAANHSNIYMSIADSF